MGEEWPSSAYRELLGKADVNLAQRDTFGPDSRTWIT